MNYTLGFVTALLLATSVFQLYQMKQSDEASLALMLRIEQMNRDLDENEALFNSNKIGYEIIQKVTKYKCFDYSPGERCVITYVHYNNSTAIWDWKIVQSWYEPVVKDTTILLTEGKIIAQNWIKEKVK